LDTVLLIPKVKSLIPEIFNIIDLVILRVQSSDALVIILFFLFLVFLDLSLFFFVIVIMPFSDLED